MRVVIAPGLVRGHADRRRGRAGRSPPAGGPRRRPMSWCCCRCPTAGRASSTCWRRPVPGEPVTRSSVPIRSAGRCRRRAADRQEPSTAYVESAQAAGLHLLARHERDPLTAPSVRRRASCSRRRSNATPGGSWSGSAVRRRTTAAPVLLRRSASAATAAGSTPARSIRPASILGCATSNLLAATDVDNPLLGLTGAVAVFGPQKGADRGRRPAARCRPARAGPPQLQRDLRADVADRPGAGAAGGLGAASVRARRSAGPGIDAGVGRGRPGRRDGRRRPGRDGRGLVRRHLAARQGRLRRWPAGRRGRAALSGARRQVASGSGRWPPTGWRRPTHSPTWPGPRTPRGREPGRWLASWPPGLPGSGRAADRTRQDATGSAASRCPDQAAFAPYHGKVWQQGLPIVSSLPWRQPIHRRQECPSHDRAGQTDAVTQRRRPPTGVLLTDVAAAKVKTLLEQEGRDDLRCASPCSPAGAPACATSCSSTSASSTATPSSTSAASTWSSTG